MDTFLVALRKELLEQWRTRRLLVLAAVLLIFGFLSPLLARYTPELIASLPETEGLADLIPTPTVNDAVGQYLENMSQFGVILALLLTMGAVAQEKERGTAAMILVKPMPRWAFLGAKFGALLITFAVSLALAGAGAYYYTYLLFEPLDLGRWLALHGLVLLHLMVYVALTLLCSVLMRTPAAAGGLAFALLLVLAIPGVVPQIGRYLPGQLIALAGGVMAAVPDLAWGALWVSVGLIVASLAGAWLIFRRQEL
jgi:ABC-2 type transport system permease protein